MLSLTERKVLTLLEKDGRMPASKIAKKTRLSAEGVIKIIKRLQDRNIITKFNTKINYSRLGYRLYPIQIKLTERNKETIKKITNIIKSHPTCAWYIFCEGEYDLLLSFKIFIFYNQISANITLYVLLFHKFVLGSWYLPGP